MGIRNSRVLKGPNLRTDEDLESLLEQAESSGAITEEEADELLLLDLIVAPSADHARVYVAAEISITANQDDVNRAADRAEILWRVTGFPSRRSSPTGSVSRVGNSPTKRKWRSQSTRGNRGPVGPTQRHRPSAGLLKQSSCPGPKTHVLDEARRPRRDPGAGGKPSAKSTSATGRIRGLRNNAQHQMTSTVTRKYSELVIEDLNVAGLMRGNTPRAQADAGMGDIKRQLIYKGQWRHTRVILAPMWFPSSKTCSACGTVNPNLKREPRAPTAGPGMTGT